MELKKKIAMVQTDVTNEEIKEYEIKAQVEGLRLSSRLRERTYCWYVELWLYLFLLPVCWGGSIVSS